MQELLCLGLSFLPNLKTLTDMNSRIHPVLARTPLLLLHFFCMFVNFFSGSRNLDIWHRETPCALFEAALVTPVTPRVFPNPRVRLDEILFFCRFSKGHPLYFFPLLSFLLHSLYSFLIAFWPFLLPIYFLFPIRSRKYFSCSLSLLF